MRNRVERLRGWLLGGAVFLLLVIVAFVLSARYLRRQFLKELPIRMALNVLRETANPTYCDSDQGQKKFCIHAAKSIEYNDGKMKLRDVSMTLYGRNADRNDRIYGDEFEYDKNAQVVRATGVVHIDLQAAAKGGQSQLAGATPSPGASSKVIHITTSGLVYLQKLGVAATSNPIEFEAGGMTGHAVGADYSSDSAIVTLHSAVTMSGMEGGEPLTMTAATAQFDDRSQQALLTRATYASQGRTASADQATLYRRTDGTLSRIDARGNVTAQAKGSTVLAQHADAALTATSQPQTVVLTGAVKYSADQPLRQVSGQADEATINFDAQAKPQPDHALFAGAVRVTERTRATTAPAEPWSTRGLKAGRVQVELSPSGPGTVQVRDVAATGNPHLSLVNKGSLASSAGGGTTELSADNLNAHLIDIAGEKTPQVDTIEGRGNTLLHQVTADGKEQTVAADSLDAKMRPQAARNANPAGGSGADKISQSLLSSVQVGHVQMMRRTPVKSGSASAGPGAKSDAVEHALADRAVYDGDADRMTLSGGVQLSDPGSMLWADQVALDHKTGNAQATGSVKVSYTPEPPAGGGGAPAQPAHVLADRADLEHATDTSTFYGKPVRLWQGGNQISAPVIELSNSQQRLVARGDGSAGEAQVRTVLAQSSNQAGDSRASSTEPCAANVAAKAGAGSTGMVAQAGVVKIVSGGLTYAGSTRQADFTGGFRADTPDGTIRAGEAIVTLQQPPAQQGPPVAGVRHAEPVSMSGELDRVVATGRVELDKPGLKATGERLVYTAIDRTALLTGDAKNPPRAVEAQGTTTGNALRLRSSCDGTGGGSVEVLGAPGQRVHSNARISDEGRKEKAKR